MLTLATSGMKTCIMAIALIIFIIHSKYFPNSDGLKGHA